MYVSLAARDHIMWSVATALVDIALLEIDNAYWTAFGTPEPLCRQSQQQPVAFFGNRLGAGTSNTGATLRGSELEREGHHTGVVGPAVLSSESDQDCDHLENSSSDVTDPRDLSHAVVLLSGATDGDGIGVRVAAAFERAGARVVLVGRRTHEEAVASSRQSATGAAPGGVLARAVYIQADLAEESCGAVVAAGLRKREINRLDAVIHLAAAARVGPPGTDPEPITIATVGVTLRAPIILTRALHAFFAHGARVVFVSSVASTTATPNFALYTACKAGVDAYAICLSRSSIFTTNDGVVVQLMHPGATRTGLFAKCGVPRGAMDTSTFADPDWTAGQVSESLLQKQKFPSIHHLSIHRWLFI